MARNDISIFERLKDPNLTEVEKEELLRQWDETYAGSSDLTAQDFHRALEQASDLEDIKKKRE